MRQLVRQLMLRKDPVEYDQVTIKLPPEFVTSLPDRDIRRGDFINLYIEEDGRLTIVAEKNPFGQPSKIPLYGRKRKESEPQVAGS